MIWWLACRPQLAPAPPPAGAPLPEPGGPAILAEAGSPRVSVRVGPAVAAVGDPRFRGKPERYHGQDQPWRRTEEERIAASAYDLADLLCRMATGRAGCGIEVGEGALGPGVVAVGRPEDFGLASPFEAVTPLLREQRLVRTTEGGVLLLGAAAAGVEGAVWDLARSLGYRYYLPLPAWEIVPDHREDELEVPALDDLVRG